MRFMGLRGVAAGACLLWAANPALAGAEIKWAKSFESAMAQAKSTKKLVMADFYTDW